MPADYHSTVRVLSLPPSPEESDLPPFPGIHSPWSQSSRGRRGSLPLSIREAVTWRDGITGKVQGTRHLLSMRWGKMPFRQRILAIMVLVLVVAIALAFMVLTGQVFFWLGPVAERWKHLVWVHIVLWICVFCVSFPPMVGWTTLGTVAGFIFGFWKGWVLYGSATIVGSICALIVSRTVLSRFVHRLMEHDTRFAALALTLEHDGLKLLCMIRLCPLPYSLCNGAMSTFPTVHPLTYGLATAMITPKLMVHVFIGSRLRILSDKNQEMSLGLKILNIVSILVLTGIGIFTGWYIYRRTLARARQLEAEGRANILQSPQAGHNARQLRRSFSDDPEANPASTTPTQDEETGLGSYYDPDNDNIDLIIDEDDDDDDRDTTTKPRYHDELTNKDSDVFGDGNGDNTEVYSLRTHVNTHASSTS